MSRPGRTRALSHATKRDLIGRKIVFVEWRPFDDGRGCLADNPVFTLDNGRRVWFVTQETEDGDYGTSVCISGKQTAEKKKA